jgi:spore coat protein H
MKCAIFIFLGLSIYTFVFTQSADLSLDLPDTLPIKDKNLFSIWVDPQWEFRLAEISGQKLKIPSCEIDYNGTSLKLKSCKTRGHATLFFRRKSFSISLIEPMVIGDKEISRLALNNLAMDRNYYRNRLSFLLMERIGIFHLESEFSELRINGNPAGLYLALQKHEDFVRSVESPLLARREINGRFTREYSQGKYARYQMKRLRNIRKLRKEFEGQQLYDSLNSIIHLEHYFQWLAFNYLIKNGDYTDELFLYLPIDENRFDIIPWDYDDIFMSEPHEGLEIRNRALGNKLLFSSEASIDMAIANDKFLYLKYLQNLKRILEILNPDVLNETFEKVYAELYPYYADQEVIAQSQYDHYGRTDLSILKADLRNQFQATVGSRKIIESIIVSELERLME